MAKIKLSFVDESKIKTKILLKSDLEALLKAKRVAKDYVISDLDLSEMNDCSCIDFDGFKLQNIIFSRFDPESPDKRFLFNLSFVGAELHQVSFAQAHLQQCNFDTMDKDAIKKHHEKWGEDSIFTGELDEKKTILEEVDFFFCQLDYCRFRNTSLEKVDFRYSHVKDCTMGEVKVKLGDFYFCAFQGCTNFIGSRFTDCSFTCATFEHHSIRMSNIPDGIVQEYSDKYHNKLLHQENWMRYNQSASFSSMNPDANSKEYNDKSKANIAYEAAEFYKGLSGMFAGKGLNEDSNKAYKKSKDLELDFCKLELILDEKDRKPLAGKENVKAKTYRNRMWHIRLIKALGYGFQWKAPTLWFGIIVLVWAAIYLMCNHFGEVCRSFSWSLNNSMSPHEEFTKAFEQGICYVGTLIASLESVAGVLLIGFLGFIIANKVRNNS